MANGNAFDFLSSSWGIELQASAKEEISEQAESLSKKDIEEYIKDSDIRKLSQTSKLPKEITRIPNGTVPPGQYMVQVQRIADITQPSKFQEDFEGGKWRLLIVELATGDQKFKALEFEPVKFLGVHLAPGTKLLLISTSKWPLRIQNGHLLLVPDAVQVLGGHVEKLVESWKASKDVLENRLLWRTEGVRQKKDGGAPTWVDFDPRKAPWGGAAKKAVEEERASWKQSSTTTPTSKTAAKDDEKDGPRFQKEAVVGEGSTQIKTQVSSSAFARDPSSKVKGEGKGKGKGKADSDRPRGRGRDRDEQEEKRAPQAMSSLAAFIKPTKAGELPDEAVKLLTAATSGDADGWDEAGWDDNS